MSFPTLLLYQIIVVVLVQHIGTALDCTVYKTQPDCLSFGLGTCEWTNEALCKCASNARLDVIFGIDVSGSIGFENFEIQKEWLETLVTESIGNNARIAFDLFSTRSNLTRPLQFWNVEELSDYVNNIIWIRGWTNTASLITDALQEFESNGDPNADKKLVILTDGNPCLPNSQGGCPQSVCMYANLLANANIKTIIIGVGGQWTSEYIGCLTDGDGSMSDPDIHVVADFTLDDFNSIVGGLSNDLCPLSTVQSSTTKPTTTTTTTKPPTSTMLTTKPTTTKSTLTTQDPTECCNKCDEQYMDLKELIMDLKDEIKDLKSLLNEQFN